MWVKAKNCALCEYIIIIILWQTFLFCFFFWYSFVFCFFVGTLSSYQALSIPKYINCWFYIKSTRTTSIFGAKKCCCLIKGLLLYFSSFCSIFWFCVLAPRPPFFFCQLLLLILICFEGYIELKSSSFVH